MREKIEKWLDDFKLKHNFNLAWLIRYMLGGIFTFAIEMGIYFLLELWTHPLDALLRHLPDRLRFRSADESDMWAIAISNVVSYVANYFISKYWVFRSPETKHSRDGSLFVISCAANLAVVLISARLILFGLGFLPLSGSFWNELMPLLAKLGSNVAAFLTVLVFKRFIIWNDTSKY